jgi:hypothetical protein
MKYLALLTSADVLAKDGSCVAQAHAKHAPATEESAI